MVLVWSRNSSEGFLSTPSARRATNASINKVLAGFNFYPRPLRGGRRGTSASAESRCYFYPRPLRGGRRAVLVAFYGSTQFLSTPSARRATNYDYSCSIEKVISIHALCEEGDERNVAFAVVEAEFLSTPSARRATLSGSLLDRFGEFLSTPSARRATPPRPDAQVPYGISIHALCEEGDSKNRDKISIFKQIIQHSARI